MSNVSSANVQVGQSVTVDKNILLTTDGVTGDLVINKGVYGGALTEISRIYNAGGIGTPAVLVSALGALPGSTAGARAFVTDATSTVFASIVTGGGANGVPVYNDGVNWRIG